MGTVTDLYAKAAEEGVTITEDGGAVSGARLFDAAKRVASGLRALNVGRGDRIAAWLPNDTAYLTLHAACARLGAILVAINTRFGAAEIADITGRSGAKALAVPGDAAVLHDIPASALPELEHLIVVGEAEALPDWPEVSVHAHAHLADAAPLESVQGRADDLVNIFTTSGTTSAPKFAAHRQDMIAGHAGDVSRFLEMTTPGSVVLQLLPFCGVFGFVQIMAALAAKADIVMPTAFDVRRSLELGRDHGATHMFITDDMLHRMLMESDAAKPFLTLRSCMYAGFNSYLSGLPAEAEARGVPVQGAFGMSEVFAIFAGRPMHLDAGNRHRPGGTMVSSGSRVRARDPESGDLLAHGEAGELEVKGPFMMAGYFGNPDATQAAFTRDGYLRTGDLGYTEPGHAFTYLQRMNDTLRLGGFLVAPFEIEAVVMSHPTVRDAQVVAAGTAAGNRPVAFVVPGDDGAMDEAAVIAHCQAALPKFKCPVRVVRVEAFPVTRGANGTKIQRAKLREMAEAMLAG